MEHSIQAPNEAAAPPKSPATPGGSQTWRKRPRDYGEELKGLSSSGEEDNYRKESTSAFKRQRLSESTDADGRSRGEVEDLDDGEIAEESHRPSDIAQPINTKWSPQPDSAPQAMGQFDASASVSSKDEKGGKSYRIDEDLKQDHEIDVGEQHDNTSSTLSNSLQAALSGRNHGVQLGMRTSSTTEATEEPENQEEVQTTEEQENQYTKDEKKRIRSRDPVSTFEAGKETWNFPLTASKIAVPLGASEQDSVWQSLLENWIVHLVRANAETADRLNFKAVRAGWALYFSKKMGFLRGTHKETNTIRVAAQSFMTSLDKGVIGDMISRAQPKSPARASPNEELRLQAKYFPGAEDSLQYCLSCSDIGHTSQLCPLLKCRFCERNHNSFGCPTRQRCDKCRQIGHSVDRCQEKLALAPDELGGCAFCSGNHQDQNCFQIWKSFRPSGSNMKKVKIIPIFCYECGGNDHYGPECALSDKSGDVSDNTTWSRSNHDLYIDPESVDVATAWTDVDPNQIAKGGFHILGRATRTSHTYFVSSDESEDLIHPPVTKPPGRGEIKIGSSIGTAGGNLRGRGPVDVKKDLEDHFRLRMAVHYHYDPKPLPMTDHLGAVTVDHTVEADIEAVAVVVVEGNELRQTAGYICWAGHRHVTQHIAKAAWWKHR
ncbi:hypothetical protein GGS21DRAFT_487742 [Xylaria nigripes]|nr:hypothetical protein GGS21DRAFT_487742 [Xylaria nigripes]